jgi:hypothetical protein
MFRHLSKGATATVRIQLANRPIPLENFKDNKDLGRIMLRKGGETVAAGVVTKVGRQLDYEITTCTHLNDGYSPKLDPYIWIIERNLPFEKYRLNNPPCQITANCLIYIDVLKKL